MISGIKNQQLADQVNNLPFIDSSNGFIYDNDFFEWMDRHSASFKDLFEKMKNTCFDYQVQSMSDDEIIDIMNQLWDKWIESGYGHETTPKPDWLSNNVDYIELDDIVL